MKYKLYTTSIKAWDAMMEEISKAKKSIYIEMYIFDIDTKESHNFLGKLAEKAQQGVRVVIVADAFGSKQLKKEAPFLNESGIEVVFFSHWLRHIHKKSMVIDKKIAFIGGVNIGKRFAHWNDVQLKVYGKIAQRVLRSFAYAYEMAGGKDEKTLAWRKKKFSYKLRFWLVEHLPTKNIHTLRRHYTEKITNAKKNIQIVTPYFAPPRWLASLLDTAIARGVNVEIIVPKKTDWEIMNITNRRYMEMFHSSGIIFYLAEIMNHSKILLIDGKYGLVGSQNMDQLSFRINTEIGLFFTNKKLLRELSSIFEQWKADSEQFNPQGYRSGPLDYVAGILIRIFRSIL